jgi:hypothetical protein
MTVVNQILSRLDNINKPQEKFLQVLFATMLTVHSHINFLSLGRHSELSERTFRRRFRRDFDFPAFNRETIRKPTARHCWLLLKTLRLSRKAASTLLGSISFGTALIHESKKAWNSHLLPFSTAALPPLLLCLPPKLRPI